MIKINRRSFLKRLAWTSTAIGASAIYPTCIEPRSIQVRRVNIPIAQLPPSLDGFTIAHLTDLHRSRYVSAAYLADAMELTSSLHPDLIAFTGDYITHGMSGRGRLVYGKSGEAHDLAVSCADIMAKARAPHGRYACLGNHDHWFDGDIVTGHLQNRGIHVLRNASTAIHVGDVTLSIVGFGDEWTEGVRSDLAFAGVTTPFSVVLMHNPDYFARWKRPGAHLILAGHTHGGQVRLPILGCPVVPSDFGDIYAHGLFRTGDTHMYVNRGLGLIFPPVRFNCRPEIALLRLQSA